jgi:predicted metal-binding membrane protein
MASERASQQTFFGLSLLAFAVSTAVTIAWCNSMSTMGQMEMPSGWTMSMTWMRMPGQSWSGAAATFLGMWIVMMVAMMLPSLVPVLWRYRQAVARTIGPVALGYFFVWTLLGAALFPLGCLVAAVEMQVPLAGRLAPAAAAVVILLAGALQCTAWKTKHLACCREIPVHGCQREPVAGSAWKYGLRLGVHCSYCCAPLTAILLVIGVMDLQAMAAMTVAITAERLIPDSTRVARVIGAVVIVTGLMLLARTTAVT